jgi:hypothetical protein
LRKKINRIEELMVKMARDRGKTLDSSSRRRISTFAGSKCRCYNFVK